MMNLWMRRVILLAGLCLLLLTGCASGIQAAAQQPTSVDGKLPLTSTSTVKPTVWKSPTLSRPSQTSTSTQTPLPTNTPTPSPTFTPAMVYYPAGQINVPILLYHRIVEGEAANRYEVSLEEFRLQMDYLRRNGYETITPVQLAKVILKGENYPSNR
jgi:hypothetical protein